MKPGIKTSEFKLAAGVILILAAVLAVAIWKHSQALAVAAIAGKALVSAGYAISRSIIKTRLLNVGILNSQLNQHSAIHHSEFPLSPFPKGHPMNPALFTAAGTYVAGVVAKPLGLTPALQADVASAVSSVAKVGADVALAFVNKKWPQVGAIVTALIAEVAPTAA